MVRTVQEPEPKTATFLTTLSRARSGDEVALDELFRQFYPRVQRMVHHSLATDLRNNRPWLAARFSTGDVVQEVFRSVLQDLKGFAGDNENGFAGYLAMIVRNRILDAVRYHEAARRDGRRGSPALEGEDVSEAPRSDDPSELAASEEEVERFHEVLKEFAEREQLLIRARFEQTQSFEALAEQLGYTSASAARRAFYAAQAQLALRLRQS